MRTTLTLALFSLISLAVPTVALADEVGVTSTATVKYVPPGVALVQKWIVKQIPGRVFATKADAIAAGFNASLMRMDLQQVTFIEPATPEMMAAAAATAAAESSVATK